MKIFYSFIINPDPQVEKISNSDYSQLYNTLEEAQMGLFKLVKEQHCCIPFLTLEGKKEMDKINSYYSEIEYDYEYNFDEDRNSLLVIVPWGAGVDDFTTYEIDLQYKIGEYKDYKIYYEPTQDNEKYKVFELGNNIFKKEEEDTMQIVKIFFDEKNTEHFYQLIN